MRQNGSLGSARWPVEEGACLAHPVFDRYRRVTEMPRNQRTYL